MVSFPSGDPEYLCPVCGERLKFSGSGYSKTCEKRSCKYELIKRNRDPETETNRRKKISASVKKIWSERDPTELENLGERIRLGRLGMSEEGKELRRQRFHETLISKTDQEKEETSRKRLGTFFSNIHDFEKENNCTLRNSLVKIFGQGWIQTNNFNGILPPEAYVFNENFRGHYFIRNEFIPLIEKYYTEVRSYKNSRGK